MAALNTLPIEKPSLEYDYCFRLWRFGRDDAGTLSESNLPIKVNL